MKQRFDQARAIIEESNVGKTAFPLLSVEDQNILLDLVDVYVEMGSYDFRGFLKAWDQHIEDLKLNQADEKAIIKQKVQNFLHSILAFNKSYPGGIRAYVQKAQKLLEQSRKEYVKKLFHFWTDTDKNVK